MNGLTGTCTLCDTRAETRYRLAWWKDPDALERVSTVERCNDDAACAARLAARGEAWPLLSPTEAARRYAVGAA